MKGRSLDQKRIIKNEDNHYLQRKRDLYPLKLHEVWRNMLHSNKDILYAFDFCTKAYRLCYVGISSYNYSNVVIFVHNQQ